MALICSLQMLYFIAVLVVHGCMALYERTSRIIELSCLFFSRSSMKVDSHAFSLFNSELVLL